MEKKPQTNRNVFVILISLFVVLLVYAYLQPSGKEIKIGVDASIPLVSDVNYDANNEFNVELSDKLYNELKKIKGVDAVKLYEDGQKPVIEKIDDMNKMDLVLSIQTYISDSEGLRSFVVPPYGKGNDSSVLFAKTLEDSVENINYEGNFYYYLDEFKPGYYHEYVIDVDSEGEYQKSIPYFDLSKTSSVMVEYRYKDKGNEDEIINALVGAVKSYYGIGNE